MRGKSVSYVGSSHLTWTGRGPKGYAHGKDYRKHGRRSNDFGVGPGSVDPGRHTQDAPIGLGYGRGFAVDRSERNIISGVGPLRIRQPRVRDRKSEGRFTSWILPPFMRRVPSVDALILSEGDLDGRLFESTGSNSWPERGGTFGDEHRAAERGLEKRIRSLGRKRSKRQTLCLLVGGRHLFQRPPGHRATLLAGHHGKLGGREERAGGRLGRNHRPHARGGEP